MPEREPSAAEARALPPCEPLPDRAGHLGFVAHEVRNPLSTALWSAELLARLGPEERGGARGEKLSNMCLRALQRMRLLIEDHFLTERLDARGIPLHPERVRLREALEGVARKHGDVALDVSDGIDLHLDRGLLERALDAVIAAAARGKVAVQVRAALDGTAAVVRVSGAPPAPDALAVPQKGTPSDPTGRALALFMTSRVAHALGGSLTVADGGYVLALPITQGPPAT